MVIKHYIIFGVHFPFYLSPIIVSQQYIILCLDKIRVIVNNNYIDTQSYIHPTQKDLIDIGSSDIIYRETDKNLININCSKEGSSNGSK